MFTRPLPAQTERCQTRSAASDVGSRLPMLAQSGPVSDLLAVGQWCQADRPSTRGGGRRLECSMSERNVTVYEVLAPRPGWAGRGSWRRDAIARLRFDDESRTWTLHWPSGRQFRRDPEIAATRDIHQLLTVIDGEPIAA